MCCSVRGRTGLLVVPAFLLALLPASGVTQEHRHCGPDETPSFRFGFQALAVALGEVVGQPVDCEDYLTSRPDVVQRTTTGLAYYRRATSTTAFTDGFERWALTGQGLIHWTDPEVEAPSAESVAEVQPARQVVLLEPGYASALAKHPDNPVVRTGSTGAWDAGSVLDPSVVRESDGTYQMWYLGFGARWATQGIGHATSTDGIRWTKHGDGPVLRPGAPGSWDSFIWEARVIKDGNVYKLWYQAGTRNRPMATGYASSKDGVNWTKYPGNPVFSGTSGQWDQHYAGFRHVVKVGSKYHAFYEAYSRGSSFAVGHATSLDGINWRNESPDAPVLKGDEGAWDDHNIVPSVVYFDGMFVMFYSTNVADSASLGIAVSPDGNNWMKYPTNPVLDLFGEAGAWDSGSQTALVDVIRDSTAPSSFLLYYRGQKGGVFQIGAIRSEPLPLSDLLDGPS